VAVTPLSPDRYKLQITIGGDTLERLRLAKDMLAHAMPSADDAAVIDRALTVLLADLAKKKFADAPRPGSARRRERQPEPPGADASPLPAVADAPATEPSPPEGKPNPPAAGPNRSLVVKRTRNPSAAVKRAVWLRDLGRCAFVGTGGHRCNERRFVEFHHVDPHALGGAASVDGVQLRCRRHNDYEGRIYFGRRRRPTDGGVMRSESLQGADGPASPGELVLEPVGFSVARSTS
jgi:hypothetical protein